MYAKNKYELAQQLIIKDLGIATSNVSHSRLDKLQRWLAEQVRILLNNDFQRLLNILYRIDVSEVKTKTALSKDDPADAIAALIIARELEKVDSREKYRGLN